MLVALREHKRRATGLHRFDHVVTDSTRPCLIVDQLLIERLECDPPVGVGRLGRLKGCRLDKNEMFKRPRGSLRPCVDPMSNGSALHEDDGVMSVLTRDGR